MTGIQFITDERGRKTAAVIDLKKHKALWEDIEDVLWGINSIVLYYTNQKGTRTGEFMELSASGKVVRVVANYSS